MKQTQRHRGQHMTNKHQLPTKCEQLISPSRDHITNLSDHIIKIRNFEAPLEDRALKISKRKVTLLKTSDIVHNSLAGSRSRTPNIETALRLLKYT